MATRAPHMSTHVSVTSVHASVGQMDSMLLDRSLSFRFFITYTQIDEHLANKENMRIEE